MKRAPTALLAVILLTTLPFRARAISSRVGAADDVGVGAAMGQPFGVTAKYWLSSSAALDGFAGYHWNHNFDLHVDYLLHTFSSFDISSGRLPFYAGLGGRILLGNNSQLGLRLPVGASYLFPTQPMELFVELAPVVQVVSSLGLDIDGQVGFRYYINYLK